MLWWWWWWPDRFSHFTFYFCFFLLSSYRGRMPRLINVVACQVIKRENHQRLVCSCVAQPSSWGVIVSVSNRGNRHSSSLALTPPRNQRSIRACRPMRGGEYFWLPRPSVRLQLNWLTAVCQAGCYLFFPFFFVLDRARMRMNLKSRWHTDESASIIWYIVAVHRHRHG